MNHSTTTTAPAAIAGYLDLRSLLGGQDPVLRKLILLLWLTSGGLSVIFGLAAVELNWSALPVNLADYQLHITLYPSLILAMLWLFWFGFWWAAIPTWATTFALAIHYGMPYEWALLFACSDPLGLALIAMVYRSLPEAMYIHRAGNIILFILVSFAGAVLSSVGAFIWSHATHADVTGLYPVWEGWWLGFFLQNLLIVLPLMLLFEQPIRRWQTGTRLWCNRPPSKSALRQTLIVAAILVSTALMFTWLSASLTEQAILTAAHSRDAYIWEPVALMVRDSLSALMTVLMILMIAMILFGIYLFRYWSRRLIHSHQMVVRSNRRLSTEVKERKRIQAELQQRYQMLNLMAQLDARLHAANSAQDVIQALSEYLPRQLPQMEGVLCRVNSYHRLEILLHWGRFPLIGTQHAAGLELPRASDHWNRVSLYDPDGHHNIHQVLPLQSEHDLIGVVLLGPAPEGNTSVSATLQILTEHLTLALTNLHLRERLMEDATHDPLTGLYNRRYLQSWLSKELVRSQRHGRPLSLMLIDIDHFKQLNDTLGHEAGDLALQGLSQHINEQIRQSDIVCRFGGEEIILVMPETSMGHARERAEQLCSSVAELRLSSEAGDLLPPLTVSIGLASYPQHATDGDNLIRAADHAMYQAKARGRNRVYLAS